MATSTAKTADAYLAELPPERREALSAVRDVILENLPEGFVEGMGYGMIGYAVPLSRYPNTYNGQPLGIAALASQKQYMSVYLMDVYSDPERLRWFQDEYRKSGKKLDMGKSCVRFKSLEDLPLELIGKVIAGTSVEAFIARYEAIRAATAGAGRPAAKKASAKKAPAKKAAAKKAPAKKASAKKAAPGRRQASRARV
jgi:hypothetical protein